LENKGSAQGTAESTVAAGATLRQSSNKERANQVLIEALEGVGFKTWLAQAPGPADRASAEDLGASRGFEIYRFSSAFPTIGTDGVRLE
jgi:hypothetical protein